MVVELELGVSDAGRDGEGDGGEDRDRDGDKHGDGDGGEGGGGDVTIEYSVQHITSDFQIQKCVRLFLRMKIRKPKTTLRWWWN